MRERSVTIRELCDQWIAASATPDGGIAIGGSTERYRLLANGIAFHDLSHVEMRAACLGLSKVLLLPGLNTVVDRDHQWFWAWCTELLAGASANYFRQGEHELEELLSLACRAALAGIASPDREGWERQRDLHLGMELNARELVSRSHIVLVYLAFPLLDGILKKECASYVAPDGMVLDSFGVPARRYTIGQRCSSMRDLLWLLYSNVASDKLRADLDQQRSQLRALGSGEDAFDLVAAWRNTSLHGESSLQSIGGTVFSTALLVALARLESDYDALREAAIGRIRWELGSPGRPDGFRLPSSFYPPHL